MKAKDLGVGRNLPVMGGGSDSVRGSTGPTKKVGISEVVTGVLRQSSVEGRSKPWAEGRGEGRHSPPFSNVSKLTRLKVMLEDSAIAAAVDRGSIPSIIIVEKFRSSSLEELESSGRGCGAPEPDMVEDRTRGT